jgi:exosome complex exonuclease DIS3/RRP44
MIKSQNINSDLSIVLQVLVQGHVGLNRAVDGDVVAIEMFAEDSWSAPSDVVLQDEGGDPGDVNPDEEAMLKSAHNSKEKTPTGKVVAIIRRNWRQYCGIIQLGAYQGV